MTELKEIRERDMTLSGLVERNAKYLQRKNAFIGYMPERDADFRYLLDENVRKNLLLQQGREYAWHKQGCYFFSRNKNKICDCGYAEWLKAVSDE